MKTISILLISPLGGGSTGGQASWTQRLMEHGLPDGYKIYNIDTGIYSKSRSLDMSTWTGEVSRTSRIMFLVLWHYAITHPHIVHINYSVNANHKLGMFRDLICAVLARLWRIKVVGYYRRDIVAETDIHAPRICRWLIRLLIRISNLNIVLNQKTLARMIDLKWNKQHAPVLLPNFIQDSVFHHNIDHTVNSSDRVKIIYVGKITFTKGCREILEVARQTPEADFVLFGPVLIDMKIYLRKKSNNVILGGEVTQDVILQEMISSDLFLFPSYTEGFPNAVMEAMAMGLPVIATRAGAIPEMIDDGRGGLLIDNPYEHEIIAALRRLISDPDECFRMGLYNRRKCEQEYSCSVVIDKLVSMYQQLVHDN